jgi:hypothetical protein
MPLARLRNDGGVVVSGAGFFPLTPALSREGRGSFPAGSRVLVTSAQ